MKRFHRILTVVTALAACAAPAPVADAQPAGGWAGSWNGSPVRPRPGLQPDPIEQSKALSSRGVPSAVPPPTIEYRLVPEQRVRVLGTDREIVIPSYYERVLPSGSAQAPPVTGYGTRGEGPVYVPEPRPAVPYVPVPRQAAP